MLPHHQLQGDTASEDRPLPAAFLAGEAEDIGTLPTSNATENSFIAQGYSRQIGYVNTTYTGPTYQYYDSNPPRHQASILEWLWPETAKSNSSSPVPLRTHQNEIHKSALEATRGQDDPWLLQRDAFQGWLSGNGSCLWVWGKVGCGKTVIFSSVVKHIRKFYPTQDKARVSYYYCHLRKDPEREVNLVLRRWLAQLCYEDAIPKELQHLHDSCHQSYPARDPVSDELEAVLLSLLLAFHDPGSISDTTQTPRNPQKLFLLIDALDEISVEDGQNLEVLDMLRRLGNSRPANVFVLVTSRDRQDIREYLTPGFSELPMDYDAIDKQIGIYVSNVVNSTPRLKRQTTEIKDAITSRLVNQAQGMFLWAALVMRHLRSLKVATKQNIQRVLQRLPKTLDETYQRILSGLDRDLAPKALLVLKWITLAHRPLFIEELTEVCAFKVGPYPAWESEDERLYPQNICELLLDLVVVQPPFQLPESDNETSASTHTVSLAHASLAEYLTGTAKASDAEQDFRFSPEEGHRLIARYCLSYVFHFNSHAKRHDNYILLQYAWYNWDKHIVFPGNDPERFSTKRTKASLLYHQLKSMANHEPRTAHSLPESRDAFLHSLDWLPLHKWKTMATSLNCPFFYDKYDHFWSRAGLKQAYQPLHLGEEIRILHFLPALDEDQPTVCRTELVKLAGLTDYIKRMRFPFLHVFYEPYRSRRFLHEVYVNGVCVFVSRYIKDHIKMMQDIVWGEGEVSLLWNDVLCINENDAAEMKWREAMLMKALSNAQTRAIYLDITRTEKENPPDPFVRYIMKGKQRKGDEEKQSKEGKSSNEPQNGPKEEDK